MAVFASRKLAPPVITAESKAFFDAARQGRFLIPVCTACNRTHWYPRVICPFCASDKVEWHDASGKGTIYTFSVMRRVQEPYIIAHVTLAEGPTMLTNNRRLRCRRCADRPGGHRCIPRHRQGTGGADVQAGLVSFRFESPRVQVTSRGGREGAGLMRCPPSRRRPSIFSPAAGHDTETVNGRPSFFSPLKIAK
jgi:uncharacterized protein